MNCPKCGTEEYYMSLFASGGVGECVKIGCEHYSASHAEKVWAHKAKQPPEELPEAGDLPWYEGPLSKMGVSQYGARLKCDHCGSKSYRYSDTDGVFFSPSCSYCVDKSLDGPQTQALMRRLAAARAKTLQNKPTTELSRRNKTAQTKTPLSGTAISLKAAILNRMVDDGFISEEERGRILGILAAEVLKAKPAAVPEVALPEPPLPSASPLPRGSNDPLSALSSGTTKDPKKGVVGSVSGGRVGVDSNRGLAAWAGQPFRFGVDRTPKVPEEVRKAPITTRGATVTLGGVTREEIHRQVSAFGLPEYTDQLTEIVLQTAGTETGLDTIQVTVTKERHVLVRTPAQSYEYLLRPPRHGATVVKED